MHKPIAVQQGRYAESLLGLASTESPQESVPRSMLDLLELRARANPDRQIYTFYYEDGSLKTWTMADVQRRAQAIASVLQERTARGDRVLLVYPPGLDFIAAFFGCIYAGVLPVPATYPKPRRPLPRLSAISRDCTATAALTTSQTLETLDLAGTNGGLGQLTWLATDTISDGTADNWRRHDPAPNDLAFLQYTSGSTSDPKGVMVSHRNLLCNLEMIHQAFGLDELHADGADPVSVMWLPAYHDMGLIGGILAAVYSEEGRLVLMPPTSFLKRPLDWLKAISDYKATVTGAPNFAYDLCVTKTTAAERAELDLSHLRLAFCGAEPIRSETLKRFADAFEPAGFQSDAFYPCYGLAEATLLVSGGVGPQRPMIKSVSRSALARHQVECVSDESASEGQQLVGCGIAWCDEEVAVVEPDLLQRLGENQVGEVWVRGSNVAQGYWNRSEDTDRDFRAHIQGESDKTYMRTGDLGFFSGGHLFVTGRLKEMVIVRGRNLYPQDIEMSVSRAHPSLGVNCGAAFAVDGEGQERLVVVHEVDRQYRNGDFDEIFRSVRRSMVEEHELAPSSIVLIRQASLPRTTSGKIQRNLCRQQYLDGDLKIVAQWNGTERPVSLPIGGERSEEPSTSPASDSLAGVGSAAERKSPRSKLPPLELPDHPLSASEVDRLAERIEGRLIEWLIERASVSATDLDRDRPFAELGLDSLTAVELSQDLEDWLDLRLTPAMAWNYPTCATLARYLAEQAGGVRSMPTAPAPDQASLAEFEEMLREIESLDETEAARRLGSDDGEQRDEAAA